MESLEKGKSEVPLYGEAKRKYDREWVAARRALFFSDKVCAECGSTEKLELDHIDPTYKVSHSIWSWSKKRQETEIAKCQILCRECHRIKTYGDYGDQFQLQATVSKHFICAEGHDLHKVGWYRGRKDSNTQIRCRYCIYLRDAIKRNYKTILDYEEYSMLKGEDRNFSTR